MTRLRQALLSVMLIVLVVTFLSGGLPALATATVGLVLGTLIFVSNGEQIALQNIVNLTAPQNLVLKLYTNNHTPGFSDAAGAFTEAAGSGYSAITLTGASWNTASGSDPATITYAKQTFTFTGALGNVYGYFCIRATATDLMFAELFSNGPYNVQNNGDTISITPTITGT